MQATIINVKITAELGNVRENRMLGIPADTSFAELERQVRQTFGVSDNSQDDAAGAAEPHQLSLRYVDDEKDKISVSSDDELRFALDHFSCRTAHFYFNAKTSDSTTETNAADSEQKKIKLDELKAKLTGEGYDDDVPEWKLRKLIARCDGDVEQAAEAFREIRQWKSRQHHRHHHHLGPHHMRGHFKPHHNHQHLHHPFSHCPLSAAAAQPQMAAECGIRETIKTAKHGGRGRSHHHHHRRGRGGRVWV